MVSHHLSELISIGFILVFGMIIFFLLLGVNRLLRPREPSRVKGMNYECGEEIFGEISIPFYVHYYIFALLFLIFEVEVVFLFPWAVVFQQLGTSGFFTMLVFIVLLAIGIAYPWRKGQLKWF